MVCVNLVDAFVNEYASRMDTLVGSIHKLAFLCWWYHTIHSAVDVLWMYGGGGTILSASGSLH